jgi:hypothetical protein
VKTMNRTIGRLLAATVHFLVMYFSSYRCQFCGQITLLKCMAEAHSLQCKDTLGIKGRRRRFELITRAGTCCLAGFGAGYIYGDGLSRILYDIRIPVPVPSSKRQLRQRKAQNLGLSSLNRYLSPFRRKPTVEWASDFEVSAGQVSITGSRLTKSDKPIPVAAGVVVYIDAGAGLSADIRENICWKLCESIISEVMTTMDRQGPPIKFHS